MDNSDLLTEILGYMADMDEEGCVLQFTDDAVRAVFEEYKKSEIHGMDDRRRYIKAMSSDEFTGITLLYADGSAQTANLSCPTKGLLRSAQLVLQQADFIIKNPQMFAGCEVEI